MKKVTESIKKIRKELNRKLKGQDAATKKRLRDQFKARTVKIRDQHKKAFPAASKIKTAEDLSQLMKKMKT